MLRISALLCMSILYINISSAPSWAQSGNRVTIQGGFDNTNIDLSGKDHFAFKLEYELQTWVLMGEPVFSCKVKWGFTNGGSPIQFINKKGVPINKVRLAELDGEPELYDIKFLVPLIRFDSVFTGGNGRLDYQYVLCEGGALGAAGKNNFTTPGSPNWDETIFTTENVWDSNGKTLKGINGSYLPASKAKTSYKLLRDRYNAMSTYEKNNTRSGFNREILLKAEFNLQPYYNWLAKKKAKKVTEEEKESAGFWSGASKPTPIPRGNVSTWEKTYGGSECVAINSLAVTDDGGALLGGDTKYYETCLVRVDRSGNKLWEKKYDNVMSKHDSNRMYSLAMTADGGALLGGRIKPNKSQATTDMLLVRVDRAGNKLWAKAYNSTYGRDDVINSLAVTADGGAFLGGTAHHGYGYYSMYLVRVDKNGNKLWEKTFGDKVHNRLYSLVLTADGGALLGGGESTRDNLLYLVKVDQSGEKLWEKTYGRTSIHRGDNSIAPTADGGAFLNGYRFLHDVSSYETFLIRVDSNGRKLWEKSYGLGFKINNITVTADGGALLGGGKNDMILIRVDSNGNKLWEKTYGFGSANTSSINSLSVTADGGALLGGYTAPKGADSKQMYLVKVDQNGNLAQSRK